MRDEIKNILSYIGEDVDREGLLETPDRYAKALKEITERKEFVYKLFDAEKADEMILVKDIHFYSLCEHHMLPFFGTAVVAYIPDKKIIGISKLPRCVEYFSKGLQNQERITTNIAEKIFDVTGCKGVGVTLKARHLCMEMRGIKSFGAETITTKLCGIFRDGTVRAEYLNLIK